MERVANWEWDLAALDNYNTNQGGMNKKNRIFNRKKKKKKRKNEKVMPQTKRFSFSKSTTDCPVNCLLRLPLPQATETGVGPYGALSIGNRKHDATPETPKRSGWGFSGGSETVMVGCYKHDSATETYSGAIRISSVARSAVSSDSSLEKESRGAPPQSATETLLDIILPEYGVFDLNLVGTVGLVGDGNGSGLTVSYAPDAANSRVFSSEFVDTLARKMQEDSSIFNKECEGAVLFLVAAPCTDGHLRVFGVVVWEQKEASLKSNVFVVCDIPVAETMLTSVVLFPQFACRVTNKTFRAVCASHGGEMHIITVVLAESKKVNSEQNDTEAAHFTNKEPLFVLSDDASLAVSSSSSSSSSSSPPAYVPSYTHFSWEGHEYDSWCVSRDPLDASMAFWSGGDDGKLKRWLLSAEKWRAIDSRVSDSNADQEDESGEVVDPKPTLSFVKTYDAGIVTIAPMFVHSLLSRSEGDRNKSGEGEGYIGDSDDERAPTMLTTCTSSYLVVGSYDENLRVYHIANSKSKIEIPPRMGQQEATPTREPLTPQWKKLFETPLFEVACEGGAWRCRLPPPLTFLLSQLSNGRGGLQPQVDERFVIMAAHSDFTNIYEGHIFVVEDENTLAGDEDECLVPLSVAAMQRGGVVVFAPLPRYHMLQSESLTSGRDGEAVSSAVPLNFDLIDEFAIESESEHILFLEKRPPAQAQGEDPVSATKEPLIYDICPIPFVIAPSDSGRLREEKKSGGISRILCCSFYDKEILGFTL